jgi:serine/threonine-protein kinase
VDELFEGLKQALADRYALERPIGKGGMATVYLAREAHPRRRVAIKVLNPAVGDVIGRERFIREVEIASQLSHPHVVPIFSTGDVNGLLYYVMPYVSGQSLRDKLVAEGALPFAEAIHITHDIADALIYAHGVGIVHRDIKPENVLLSGGHALVADFGIARALGTVRDPGSNLTIQGVPIGTPGYMSPEQASGGAVDARTDQYSLAAVLYEMLNGERVSVTPGSQRPRPLSGDSSAFDTIPDGFVDVVYRALSWNLEDRYATTAEFAEAVASAHTAPTPHTAPRPTPTPSQQVPEKSIAVLPFSNLSTDPENEYFSDGITDDIIAQLSKISDLKVTSRTSVMQYKGSAKNLRQIGRELGVASVLEGSVRRAGDRVRIVSQLIDAETDGHRWSETYDRDLTDIFAIQSDVAGKIADALKATLSPKEKDSIRRRPTEDIEAYNLYLQGVYHWNKFTPESSKRAFDNFEAAIERDPDFGLAYTGLANAYFSVALGGGDTESHPSQPFVLAREAAEHALAIDPGIADAHATLASVHYWHDWDWEAADKAFRKSTELGCGCLEPWLKYGFFLAGMARFDEGLAAARKARELDPVSLIVNTHLGHHHYWSRDFERAARQFQRTLELNDVFPPARVSLAWVNLLTGKIDMALVEFERVVEVGGRFTAGIAALTCAYAAAGHDYKAAATLGELLERKESNSEYVSSRNIALACAWMGDSVAALDWLERAYEERAPWMTFLAVDPIWDGIRDEPGFQTLLSRMGLPRVPDR